MTYKEYKPAFEGRNMIKAIDLKRTDAFLPLFECVVNAIISLKQTDIPQEEKKIQIQIIRGEAPSNTDLFKGYDTIAHIKVIDNGEGFVQANLTSFTTVHSSKNIKYGCKGIGRYTVLAAFEEISIQSNFFENNAWKCIVLKLDAEKITESEHRASDHKERKTTVQLSRCYNQHIKDDTAISIEDIAEKIKEHCLLYYLCDDLPKIEILEEGKKEVTIVNDLYADALAIEFKLGDYTFKTHITKIETVGTRKNHYIHYLSIFRGFGVLGSSSPTSSMPTPRSRYFR
jgi:hypothetical protein